MKKDNSFLATEPVGKLLFKLAIPTITAQIINMLYNIVDRIFIGHIPVHGDLALTGVGVCMPLILFVSAFAALFCGSGAPRASISMGKGDNDTAEKIMGSCFSVQLIVGLITTAVLLLWSKDLLLLFGASENTIEYAVSYMNIYAIGTVFVQLTLGINAYITAQGFTGMSMAIVMIGAILNLILDPLFIFAFNLGVRGAALATVISQFVSCIAVLMFVCGKKSILRLKKATLRIDPRLALSAMSLGIAPFVMQSSESIISVCFNSSLLKYGGDVAVGAMTILSSIMQFAMLPLHGLGNGSQPICSYNYGAKNPDRIKRLFKILLITSLIYSFTLWGAIMVFPRVFASIFTSNAELLSFTSNVLPIYCGVLCIFGAQIACQSTFVSLGKASCSVLVAVMRKFILLIPLIYIMPLLMENKTIAVYAAEPVTDILAVSFTVILFAVHFRKTLRSISTNTDSRN